MLDRFQGPASIARLMTNAAILVLSIGCTAFRATEPQPPADASSSTLPISPSAQGPGTPGIDIELGKKIYAQSCQGCHGEISTTRIKDRTISQINTAIANQPEMAHLKSMPDQQVVAVMEALKTRIAATCEPNTNSFVNIHRLNNREYNNVIRDLTGLDLKPANSFPPDLETAFFDNNAAALGIDPLRGRLFFESAQQTLDRVFAQARGNIVTCAVGTENRVCAREVVSQFGGKAFRRPLLAAEIDQFLAIYDQALSNYPAGAVGNAFNESLKFSLHRILVAPQFIFRMIESPGNVSQVRDLNDYELASRLSFLIWGSIPDATLTQLAAAGTLRANLYAQVDRMLQDPKSAYLVEAFAEKWLGLAEFAHAKPDAQLFPAFTPQLQAAMLTETKMMLKDMFNSPGGFRTVLSSDYSYANGILANHYGIPGVSGEQFTRVSLPPNRRGLMTHGSILTMTSNSAESSIVKRGLWAMRRLLCIEVGTAPANIVPGAVAPPNANPRQKLAAHTSNPACASCHQTIDNLGFGLENFDGIGRWRGFYSNGDMIDAHGLFIPTNTSYADAVEYLRNVQQSDRFPICASRNLLTFALAKSFTDEHSCAAKTVGEKHMTATSTFADSLKRIVALDQFLKQRGEN